MKALICVLVLFFSTNLLADSRIPDSLQPMSDAEVQDVSGGIYHFFTMNYLDWQGYNNKPDDKTPCRLKFDLDLETGLFSNSIRIQYKVHISREKWEYVGGTIMDFDKVIERKPDTYTTEIVFLKITNVHKPEFKDQKLLRETIVELSYDEKSIASVRYVKSTQKRNNTGTIQKPKYEFTYMENESVKCSR